MNCNSVREFIAPYISLELSDEIQAQIDTHIENCAHCRTELKAQMGLHHLLSEKLERIPVDAALREKIVNRIAAGLSSVWLFRKVQISMNPAAGFAIAATLLLGVIFSSDLISIVQSNVKSVPMNVIPVSSVILNDGIDATVVGKLVCVGCYLSTNYNADYDCTIAGHTIGMLTGDGNLWSFTYSPGSDKLLKNDNIAGKKVEIEGQLFYSAHFIGVNNYKFLED